MIRKGIGAAATGVLSLSMLALPAVAAPAPVNLTIHVDSIGASGSFTFVTSGGVMTATTTIPTSLISGNVYSGTYTFNALLQDTYTISEVVPAGWELTSSTCNVNFGQGDAPYTLGAGLVLPPGSSTTCTFIHRQVATTTPRAKDDCKRGGWALFTPSYKNQGKCMSSLKK
jgi:hypothetical protein